jgi:hypothetical protein
LNRSIVFGGEAPENIRTDFTERRYQQQILDSLKRAGRSPEEYAPTMLKKSDLREPEMQFMFLNSGCFIGRVGSLLEFYKYWVNPPYFKFKNKGGISVAKDQPPRVILPIKTLWDARLKLNHTSRWPDAYFRRDQFTAIHMYLDGVADSSVDAQGKIFLSTFMGGSTGLAHYLRKDESQNQTRTISIRTSTTPAVLHFAGASKYLQCLSKYVKTFLDPKELEELFVSRHQNKGTDRWRDGLVMLDANLDLVPPSLVTPELVKSWIPRYPMRCHADVQQVVPNPVLEETV